MSRITKASRMLSHYIRQIADEKVKPLEDADAEGGVRMATRAEALARQIWQRAEGYTEHLKEGKEKTHAPDKAMVTLLIERMEGRVPTIDAKDQKPKASVAERVSEQARQRMSVAVKDSEERAKRN